MLMPTVLFCDCWHIKYDQMVMLAKCRTLICLAKVRKPAENKTIVVFLEFRLVDFKWNRQKIVVT